MTPEELELKERDVSAREKANELTERSLNIEERKSKLNFWGMIATAFIGLSGVVFGLLYVNDQKNQDLTALHKKIDKLHDNDCSKELAQQRLFYDSGELGQVKDYARRIWAELHMQGIISESNENVVD